MEQSTKDTLKDIGKGIAAAGIIVLTAAAAAAVEADQPRVRDLDDLIRKIELSDDDLSKIALRLDIRPKSTYSAIERATILEMLGREWSELWGMKKDRILEVIFNRLYSQSSILHASICKEIARKIDHTIYTMRPYPFSVVSEADADRIMVHISPLVC